MLPKNITIFLDVLPDGCVESLDRIKGRPLGDFVDLGGIVGDPCGDIVGDPGRGLTMSPQKTIVMLTIPRHVEVIAVLSAG